MRKFFILVLCCFSWSLHANLSPQAKAYLLTIAPGKALYSSFGHSMLLIQDPMTGIEKAYSYGTFDFQTEGFYWKFLKGTLPYTISEESLAQVDLYYRQYEQRSIIAQELNLNQEQINALFQALETNLLPQNREYQYKFYFDNCSTRLRDALERLPGVKMAWEANPALSKHSYRAWMNQYLDPSDWASFGMNLGLGQAADALASPRASTYLPDNLLLALNQAKNGELPLVASTQTWFQGPSLERTWNWSGPMTWMLVWFLAILWAKWKNKSFFWHDRIAFTLLGLLGCFMAFLWLGTNHGVMNWNPSLLVLFPSHAMMIWFAHRPGPFIKIYARASLFLGIFGALWASYNHWPLLTLFVPILSRWYDVQKHIVQK